MRRVLAATAALTVLTAAYLSLDVLDVVPGVLTRDRPVTTLAVPSTPAAPSATPTATIPTAGTGAEPLAPAAASAPVPTEAGLRRRLATALADPALGSSVGASVRDARSGATLLALDAERPRVPASVAKLLTAAAVGATLGPTRTLVTSVVAGATPTELVLRAGGDTMLAPGAGRPSSVEGRAGLADLAASVATALPDGTTRVGLRLDLTYAAGPRYAPGWVMADVRAGFTQGVAMVGLAGQRPVPGKPSPTVPERSVQRAFVSALAAHGITAVPAPESTWRTAAPAGARVLGSVQSAPVGDILALALDDSDNALTEGLARQAAVSVGSAATFEAAVAFVRTTVTRLGVDLTGVRLSDTSGLSAGQVIPARVLSDVLALGVGGSQPALAHTLAQLPVAGLDGTLHGRFHGATTRAAAGVARAKTGTLTGVSSLAGTVVDRDGRLLTFVVMADRVSPVGTPAARAALDRVVAALATCGCR